jgi:hypothetical protein
MNVEIRKKYKNTQEKRTEEYNKTMIEETPKGDSQKYD